MTSPVLPPPDGCPRRQGQQQPHRCRQDCPPARPPRRTTHAPANPQRPV